MICSNCGANIPDGSTFCTNCGAAIAPAAPTAAPAPQPVYAQQPVYNQQPAYAQPTAGIKTVAPGKVLTFGILGLAFSCIPWISFLGIIFSAIGLSNSNVFLRENGAIFGQAKVGRILAKVGLILSIVLTVIYSIVFLASLA